MVMVCRTNEASQVKQRKKVKKIDLRLTNDDGLIPCVINGITKARKIGGCKLRCVFEKWVNNRQTFYFVDEFIQ